jgi:hypothetical protein
MPYNNDDILPENYVVKGVLKKDNYYIDEHHIFDLEYNIPIQISLEEKQQIGKLKSIKKFP